MKIAKPHRTRTEWMELVVACESSGIGRTEFAERENLHPRTFAWWASRLAPKRSRPSKAERAVRVARPAKAPSATFIPLLVASPSTAPAPRSLLTNDEPLPALVEVVLGNGRVVRFDLAQAADPRLVRVLAVAEGSSEC